MKLNKPLFIILGLLLCISFASQAQVAKKVYHSNGKLRMTFSLITKSGEPAGLVKVYNKEGKKTNTQVVDEKGQGNGPFVGYYPTGGKVQSMGYLKKGKLHGKFVVFYEGTGNIKATGNFMKGKKVGRWTYYDQDGKYLRTRNFK